MIPTRPATPSRPHHRHRPIRMITRKRGKQRGLPPQPQNGGSMVEGEDGDYIELDEMGTPLGQWHYDTDEGKWIFDPYTPLSQLPQTGLHEVAPYVILMLGLMMVIAGLWTQRRKQK